MLRVTTVEGSLTGPRLRQMLRQRGVSIGEPADAIVSYGVPISRTNVPVLNAAAGRVNKLQELEAIRVAGVPVPPFSRNAESLQFPVLGRKFKHHKGRDIIAIPARDGVFEAARQVSDFFVQYVPVAREYRVWGYRGRRLATYEKQLRYPEKFRRLGCNQANGYAFSLIYGSQGVEYVSNVGLQAIQALDLDFGAADVIVDPGGRTFVLEVNTAPGVEEIRLGLDLLAKKIARWVQLGYPKRRGTRVLG